MSFFSKSWASLGTILKSHLLSVVLIPAVIAVGFASYYRFVSQHDYMVTYEKDCNPANESCFLRCEDESCLEEYTYALIEKHATGLYAQCGPNISNCEEAYVCNSSDSACTVTYCDPENGTDTCAPVEVETTAEIEVSSEAQIDQ